MVNQGARHRSDHGARHRHGGAHGNRRSERMMIMVRVNVDVHIPAVVDVRVHVRIPVNDRACGVLDLTRLGFFRNHRVDHRSGRQQDGELAKVKSIHFASPS